MKPCICCHEYKELSEFYAHPYMADKHLNKCKSCVNAAVKARTDRLRHDPEWVMAERERCRQKISKARARGLYRTTPNTAKKAWYSRNKHKVNAEHKAYRHYKDGPAKCQLCGSTTKLHRHHPDYSRPLDIRWLCPKCHGIQHRKPAPTLSLSQ